MHTIKRLIIIASSCLWLGAANAADKDLPKAESEQLEIQLPPSWQSIGQESQEQGVLVTRFKPVADSAGIWKYGHLSIERIPYPDIEHMQRIAQARSSVARIGLIQSVYATSNQCKDNQYTPTAQTLTRINGLQAAIGGGFCSQSTPESPHGQGSLIAIIEGQHYYYRVTYEWRPRTHVERMYSNWGIDSTTIASYMGSIKTAHLCNGSTKQSCTQQY